MSRLVESIKVYNGRMYNIKRHQARFDFSRQSCFENTNKISLRHKIKSAGLPESGLYKCRIVYNDKIQSIEFFPYHRSFIKQLKIVHSEPFDYAFKWEKRKKLDALFAKRERADEIIIVIDKVITDGYYYNLVFEKDGIFHTPQNCLLKGTQRQKLLENNKIVEKVITLDDLHHYDFVHCINALNPLFSQVVPVSDILI